MVPDMSILSVLTVLTFCLLDPFLPPCFLGWKLSFSNSSTEMRILCPTSAFRMVGPPAMVAGGPSIRVGDHVTSGSSVINRSDSQRSVAGCGGLQVGFVEFVIHIHLFTLQDSFNNFLCTSSRVKYLPKLIRFFEYNSSWVS